MNKRKEKKQWRNDVIELTDSLRTTNISLEVTSDFKLIILEYENRHSTVDIFEMEKIKDIKSALKKEIKVLENTDKIDCITLKIFNIIYRQRYDIKGEFLKIKKYKEIKIPSEIINEWIDLTGDNLFKFERIFLGSME